jgi:hypothetical protein
MAAAASGLISAAPERILTHRGNAMPTALLYAFIEKLPEFDPTWPDDLRQAWLDIAGRLLREAIKIEPPESGR